MQGRALDAAPASRFRRARTIEVAGRTPKTFLATGPQQLVPGTGIKLLLPSLWLRRMERIRRGMLGLGPHQHMPSQQHIVDDLHGSRLRLENPAFVAPDSSPAQSTSTELLCSRSVHLPWKSLIYRCASHPIGNAPSQIAALSRPELLMYRECVSQSRDWSPSASCPVNSLGCMQRVQATGRLDGGNASNTPGSNAHSLGSSGVA